MKTRLIKTILALTLALVALPMMGQDYLTVFFKNGNKESFFLGAVMNFYVSKYDTLGVIHDDYQTQIVETTKRSFIYDLAEIDSVTFTKFNEQQVKKNFASALSASDAVFSKCDNISDLPKYINELKEAEGIEYVSYDDNSLYVSVKDWLTIVYYFDTLDTTMSEESARSFEKTVRRGKELIQQYGSPYKDFSVVEAIAHSPVGVHGSDEKDFFEPLKKEFEDCHILVKPVYPSLSNNFYTEEIFKHDIVFYSGHGGYDKVKDLHSLQTADEWGIRPKSYVLTNDEVTLIYNWLLSLLNTDAISLDEIDYGIYGDFRSTGWVKVYGASITQKYIENSMNKFDEPAIVYIAACKTLSENFKVANLFLKKGALAYFGSANKQSGGVPIGKSFFENLLNGMSMESARQNINWLQSTNTVGDWVSADYKVVYLDPSDQKKQFHLFNTYTKPVVPRTARAEYLDNRKATITGVTTLLDTDHPKVKFGFRYGKDSNNLDKTIKGKHDSSIVDEFGNFHFSAIIDLSDYQDYYFQAYTDDGYCYNLGDIQQIKFFNDDIPAEPIDLGLPSGTLWASYNVGATAQEEYGGYFAWGELEEKDVFNESNYQFCQNGIYKNIGDDIGGTEYDVAHARWGDKWMMPNKRMMQELYENCTTKWTTSNGVYGMEFTGPNGNTLFLPAAGYQKEDKQLQQGVWGDYWASTISEANTYSAYELYFKNGLINCNYIYNDNPTYRRNGHTVRPVIPGLELTSYGPLSILKGESETVSVRYGSGSYRYEVDKEGIVSVSIVGSTITISALNGGEAVVTIIDNNGGKANISVAVKAIPEAKDLGLPSGTKWATFNIGANSPEDYGEYYAWGENGVKDTYTESTYEYCKNGMYTKIGNDIRGTQYDTAREKWGGEWMMPSTTQFNELIANCTSTWVKLNGVYVRKFTSKINGESIYFPAAGYFGSKLNNNGTYGYYWAGNIDPDNVEKAYTMIAKSATPSMPSNPRYIGFSIRPVISGLELSTTGTLTIFEGTSKTITIKSGSGSYQLAIDKEGIVSASIMGTTITINALKAGDIVFSVTDTQGGQKANIVINVRAVPKAIDLGLPSGTKWANINVGANSPEEFGDYFAWGETETKSVYTTSTYKHYKSSSYVDIGNDIRGSEYDAARAKWGDKWLMPSSIQIKELIDNCTSEWTTQNGVNGRKFISKINGESIFLPAVGFCENGVSSSGTSGYYWACDKVVDKNNGYNLCVKNDAPSLNAYSRYYGFAIRPVIRGKKEDDDPRIDEVVSEITLEKIKDHMPVYSGTNPPNIEGTYLISPYTVIFCEDGNWDPGYVISDYKIRFFNQSSNDNTIDMIDYNTGNIDSYDKGTGAFISGDGTHFSIFFNTEGYAQNIFNKKSLVISGTKTADGIQNLHYGFTMEEKGSDPDNKLMDTGVYRIFKDGDGISGPTTWEFESNARKINSKEKRKVETMVDGPGLKAKEHPQKETNSIK